MKPLSAMYYIKQNKMRCSLMIFILVLTYVVYIIGLYVTNIQSTFEYSKQRLDKFAEIQPAGTLADMDKFQQAKLRCMENDKLLVIEQANNSVLYVSSAMGGLKNGYPMYAFKSPEDFKSYCEYMDIKCDFDKLKDGSAVMSEMFAANRGIETGDEVEAVDEEVLYGNYTLDAVTDEMGYSFYTIGGEDSNISYLVLPLEMDLEEFEMFLKELEKEYGVEAVNGETLKEVIYSQLSGINSIYFFIVIFMAIVMAATINAVFVGMYQKREPEFAVYQAIGIGRKRIRRKLIGEILVMDFIGLIIGGIVCFTGLYLLNTLYLMPRGKTLFYYNRISLLCMLVCNVVVVAPLIITRSRQMMRTDICKY